MSRRVRCWATLALAIVAGALAAVGWRGSTILLRRRAPDPPDPPSHYGLRYEEVAFPGRDGVLLHGWWIPSAPPGGPALVFVHGHNGSMDGDTAQAAWLVREGFSVLLFNLRAHGTSGGSQVTFGAREWGDVLGALDWLEAARGVRRAGLVGFSMGAGVALMAAAGDSRVAAVVADGTISRVIDAMIGLGRQKGLPPALVTAPAWAILLAASLRARAWLPAADPIRRAGRVRCPVLFVHGAEDPFNTDAGAGQLAALAPRGQLWRVEGAAHRDAYARFPEAYYARITTFLRGALEGEE